MNEGASMLRFSEHELRTGYSDRTDAYGLTQGSCGPSQRRGKPLVVIESGKRQPSLKVLKEISTGSRCRFTC